MTSGSCWTHLMVIGSGALVQPLEEGVLPARVAGQASMPAEDRDRLVEGQPGGWQLERREHGRQGGSDPLAQRDQVVERYALASIERRVPVGVLARRTRIAGREGDGDAIGEELGIVEP